MCVVRVLCMCVCDCLFVSVQTEMEKATSLEAKHSLAEILALENMLKDNQVPENLYRKFSWGEMMGGDG